MCVCVCVPPLKQTKPPSDPRRSTLRRGTGAEPRLADVVEVAAGAAVEDEAHRLGALLLQLLIRWLRTNGGVAVGGGGEVGG